ncbi:acetate kinase [Oceanospirillum multiglobuliferum]|uniref:Acetate kinase n=1 Tax=Oceanospirillum multiglobuliferum TaxID=64969 RepID=A0A1T4Q0X7_9GAMM|nr:acetate/propionate family kinase [Oceanospirillum multiglobuliferum]OPX55468.1 acetate kinase [Oceanospirillum multiglobuliferum]SJZ97480.1 acetate kinase [Oceanospirillum multiglobuliferum]
MNSILIVNAGSSSLKCSVFDEFDGDIRQHFRVKVANLAGPARLEIYDHSEKADGVLVDKFELSAEELDVAHSQAHHQALSVVLKWLDKNTKFRITQIGHRVVHGGDAYSEPVVVTNEVLESLKKLIPLAPLHQPYNLKLIDVCKDVLPGLPQVACFDTAFHSTIPDVARNFAIPRALTHEGVRRYGFHGLSYQYILNKLQQLDPELASSRIVTAHLGAGASMCAIHNGESVASTMGFTALDGLPMGSRCGQIDPGVLLYLMREHKMDVDAIESLLYKNSGWQGVSGISSDMLTLHKNGSEHAREAIDMFVYRIARETGSLVASMGGLDTFVFTGGVGENDAEIRAQVARQNEWLGMKIDPQRNATNEYLISADDSKVKVFAIPTNEELMIARHTSRLLR